MTEGRRILESAQLVEHLLKDRATLFRGRLEDLDKALGRSRFYFVRMLQGPDCLRLDDFLKATETLGFHPSEYLKRLQGDHHIFAELPPRFLETRKLKDRKSSRLKDLEELSLWAHLVRIDPAGERLTLRLQPYLDLLGNEHPQNEEVFGKALLEILIREQPATLTLHTAIQCGYTLVTLAKCATRQNRHGEALELLSIAFCLAQKSRRYDLKADVFFATSDTLHRLGFGKDASWCAYEGILLAIGTGSFEKVSQGLDLYDAIQENGDDHLSHLIKCAVDERKASSFILSKQALDQPLCDAGITFSRLTNGKQKSKLSFDHWQAFTQGLVTPLALNRALRMPFVPDAGSTFLRAYLSHLEQEPCSTEHDSYLVWINDVAIQSATGGEPNVSFKTVDHAQGILSQTNRSKALSRAAAFTHAVALATCAHHYRLTGDHPLAYRLFKACLELESRIESLPLRSHLLRLSAYLFRDTGFLLEAHLSSWRSLHCALAGRDAYALSHATYTTATLHMLFDEYEEATWLLRGCLRLSESSTYFTASVHLSIASCLIKRVHLGEAVEHLRHAEHLKVPGTPAYLLGLRGVVASFEGEKHEADTWFEASEEAFEEIGFSMDRLLVGLYRVVHLLRFGEHYRADQNLRHLTTLAKQFPLNEIIRATIKDLDLKTRQGHLTLALVEHVCKQVECPWVKRH